jgi:hypothetical protein
MCQSTAQRTLGEVTSHRLALNLSPSRCDRESIVIAALVVTHALTEYVLECGEGH